jgi:alginate O-acetyltransferase complex protein AlgJ
MQASAARERLYLKTDTHWSPAGAQLAAQITSQLAQGLFRDIKLPLSHFSSQAGGMKTIVGDLTNYMPGVALPADQVVSYVSGISVASNNAAQGLFGDAAPAVTLVGTSYSANPNWNFDGFLKVGLKSDVLNMADQGLGPFVVMDKYLQSDAWKTTPPRLLIWEMPERYFLMPHGVVK